MSTWISKYALIAVLLPGCVAPDGSTVQRTPSVAAPVVGTLRIAAPNGYCPLDESRVHKGNSEFIALGPCAQGASAAGPGAAILLTAIVGSEGSALGLDLNQAAVKRHFDSPAGRSALSSDGNPKSVEVIAVTKSADAILVQMSDRSASETEARWRAIMQLHERLVLLSARSPAKTASSDGKAKRLISDFAKAMRRANPG